MLTIRLGPTYQPTLLLPKAVSHSTTPQPQAAVKHLDDAHDQVDLVIATALRERKPVRQSPTQALLVPAIALHIRCRCCGRRTVLRHLIKPRLYRSVM